MEWLGDVPAHWETQRLKSVAGNISEQTLKRPKGMGYIALEHVESWTGRVTCEAAEPGDGQLKRFRPGDVLFGKLRPYLAKVVHAKSHGLCVGEFFVLRTRRGISPRFLEYVLRSTPSIEWINSSTFGARMPRADWAFIGDMRFPVPAPTEQAAIARFLDHATSRIDRYIRAKEKLIALLEEQKRTIIHEVVTGRIDVRTGRPYAAYKPSGVDWLVEVPEHWHVRRLGSLARVFNGATPSRAKAGYWDDGNVPWLNSSKVNDEIVTKPSEYITRRAFEECSVSLVPKGSVVVGLVGQGRTRGMCALLGLSTTISQNLAAIIPAQDADGAYLHRFLDAHYAHLRNLGRGGNQEALNCDLVARLRILVPPKVEQEQVVRYLHRKLSVVDAARLNAKSQIALLREYRARLIADVVTGKLDVRGTAPALPRQADLAVFDLAEA